MIIKIRPPVIQVTNLQEAENFFRCVFDFQVIDRDASSQENATIVQMGSRDSSASIRLLLIDRTSQDAQEGPRPTRDENWRITVFTDDIVKEVDALIARGGTFVTLPGASTRRTRYAGLLGPEDRVIDIVEAAE